jgi:hypothetical protein
MPADRVQLVAGSGAVEIDVSFLIGKIKRHRVRIIIIAQYSQNAPRGFS